MLPGTQTGLDKVADDGISTKSVPSVRCSTSAKETDGTITCVGIPEGSLSQIPDKAVPIAADLENKFASFRSSRAHGPCDHTALIIARPASGCSKPGINHSCPSCFVTFWWSPV